MTTKAKLTTRQQTFVNLYALGNISATQAYIDAGFGKASAHVEASKALTKPKIQDAIAKRKQELAESGEKLQLTPERILKRAQELAWQNDNLPVAAQSIRTLADIMGMLQGGRAELSTEVTELMEALGRGIGEAREQRRLERTNRPELAEPKATEAEGRVVE